MNACDVHVSLRVRRSAAIGFGFRAERFFADRSDERLVIGFHHDDAPVGDGMSPPIFFRVIPDERAAREKR